MQSLPNLLDIPFDFDAPQFLLLLFLLSLFWFVSRRSLAALGSWRRRIALASSLIIAFAEPNWLRILHRRSKFRR